MFMMSRLTFHRKALPVGRRGFSLIELMLYAAILSVVLVVITNTFLSIVDLQLESQSTSGLAQDGQYVFLRLNNDLRQASAITAPTLGGSSSSLTVVVDGMNYLYQLDGNSNLSLTVGASPPVILNSYQTSLSDLTFTHLGNGTGEEDLVRINYTIISRTVRKSGRESRSYQTTVGLRPN